MGVDAELYAAAAASHDQSACTESQDDVKHVPAAGGGAAGENATRNDGVNSGTQQEGVFVFSLFICTVVN